MKPEATEEQTLDRYRSFCGLECQARAEQLVKHICQISSKYEPTNPFWSIFVAKTQADNAPDGLFLVHSYIFYMRELLQKHADIEGLAQLEALETDCC